jgi:uncharacterized lipoprotein YmbA
MTPRPRGPAALLALITVMGGCATSSPPMALHTLVPPAASAVAAPARPDRTPLGVAIALPIIPDEVDRAQLVMRSTDGSIAILDNERWAEPLKAALPRANALALAS